MAACRVPGSPSMAAGPGPRTAGLPGLRPLPPGTVAGGPVSAGLCRFRAPDGSSRVPASQQARIPRTPLPGSRVDRPATASLPSLASEFAASKRQQGGRQGRRPQGAAVRALPSKRADLSFQEGSEAGEGSSISGSQETAWAQHTHASGSQTPAASERDPDPELVSPAPDPLPEIAQSLAAGSDGGPLGTGRGGNSVQQLLGVLGAAAQQQQGMGDGRPGSSDTAAREQAHVRCPRSIHEISNGDHILGFGAQLAEDHPGYRDEAYKLRRTQLANLAKTHVIGQPIPTVDYTVDETAVWDHVLSSLLPLYPTHACSHFLRTFPTFGFSPHRVPQLEEVSEMLQSRTGWRIRPVAGLLHPRDFLNGLAFRYFHSTQYIRHGSQPMYTPEPDICHELLGHAPMLADPDFADLAQAIGQASLGASEKDIWHLTKLYWYTMEFGTIMEDGEVKAFGAGLLSSYGELAYLKGGMLEDDGTRRHPGFVELDPFAKLPKMSYKDGFQRTYFLCSSFQEVSSKLRAYAALLSPSLIPHPQLAKNN